MLLLLICGLYSGERIFFLGFFILCCMLLLSLVSLLYSGSKFKYLQTMSPQHGVKGDTLQYRLEVHNDGMIPIPYLGVTYDSIESILAGVPADTAISLLPHRKGECAEDIYCRFRGRWPVGFKKVEIRDFFDLFSFTMDAEKFLSHKPISLLVRPRVLSLDHLPMRRKHDDGPMETAPRNTDDTALLSDVRRFREGDSMKRIHWKLTARQREIMVKNYEENSMPDLLLYMDARASGLSLLDRVSLEDTLVECATAVVHYLLGHFLPASFIFYADKRVQLRGSRPEHFQSFYSVLSEMHFDGIYPAEDILMNDMQLITQSSNLFLIAFAISDKLFDLLMLMNSSGINITVVIVYAPGSEVEGSGETGGIRHKVSEMRNAGVVIIDLHPGESIAERVDMLA
jgi:uncharacterized protein (DUF58 family)